MNNGKEVVRKHVSLLHVFSSMTNLQRKIINALFSECKDENMITDNSMCQGLEFIIPVSNLINKTGFNSNNSEYFKTSLDSLADIKIEWNLLKDKAPSNISFCNLRVLQGSPTFHVDGTVNVAFHKCLFTLLSSPEMYGTIDISLQSEFESKYSHALYENCTRFLNMRKGKIIPLDTFRKLLSVDENKYQTMREFSRNVLSRATEEVNDRSDFIAKLEKVKFGRKVTAIELDVVRKPVSSSLRRVVGSNKDIIQDEIKNAFPNIQEIVLSDITTQYESEYIREKIKYTIKRKEKTNGSYPVAYFISAIKNDYKEASDPKKNSEIKPYDCEMKQSKTTGSWKEKYEKLLLDKNHWIKFLSIQEERNTNETLLNNTRKTLEKSKNALDEHIKNKENYIEDGS